MLADSTAGDFLRLSEEEKIAIQKQLDRLLRDPHFSHSRRFPSFLRFVVEHTLSGQADSLKERTLGVEIFGKNADYDTASDPIVRVTAAEIRKRIAQYYQEPGHGEELRVSLPPGSYIPQFHWPEAVNNHASHVAVPSVASSPKTAVSGGQVPIVEESQSRRCSRSIAAGIFVLIVVLSAGFFLFRSLHRSAFEFFWGPVLNSSDPVLVCIADQNQYTVIVLRDAADPSRQTALKDNLSAVVMDDLNPLAKIAGILQSHGKKYSLKGEGATTLSDLQNGPTVFVGAFDNAWTLRLTKPLRFHFANNPEMTKFWIVDSSTSKQPVWVLNRVQQQTTNIYQDYAIVARFMDPNTGKLAVVAAGIGRGGTIAAGEFLTDPGNLAQLARAARAAGNKTNMEVILSTQIIGGDPGTPKIEDTYFW
ncbi:MAG: hypothetical protein WA708_01580 [Acidobacteriaceae bacterium]